MYRVKESLGIGPRYKVQIDPRNCSGKGAGKGWPCKPTLGRISGSEATMTWMWFALMPGSMGSDFSHSSAREAGLGTFTSHL